MNKEIPLIAWAGVVLLSVCVSALLPVVATTAPIQSTPGNIHKLNNTISSKLRSTVYNSVRKLLATLLEGMEWLGQALLLALSTVGHVEMAWTDESHLFGMRYR